MIASSKTKKPAGLWSGGFEWCAAERSFQGNGTHGPPDARIRWMRIRVVRVVRVIGVRCGMPAV